MKISVFLGSAIAIAMANPAWARPIYVHPQTGNDQTGDGSPAQPFRTISRALQASTGETVIQLADGVYSEEQFPLVLSRQTIVQGNITNQGASVVIKGGGNFRSLFLGQQNTAIVLQDQAQLRGVTVTNPQPRGFGVWIERGSPTLSYSTLTANSQDGISITGRAGGTITHNLVRANSANGITIDGLATPQVKHNLITQNVFGINIRQNSAPQLFSNQITNHQDGVMIQGQSRPRLRQNTITHNQGTGVMILGQAIPDLGTADNSGNNVFSDNKTADIRNQTSQTIVASGNQFSTPKLIGSIELAGTAIAPLPSPPAHGNNSIVVSLTGQPPKLPTDISPHLPPITTTPPKGDPVNQPIVIRPPRPIAVITQPPRWRVVVTLVTPEVLQQVRTLFPEAFASNRAGRSVIQIGAYSNQNIALERLQQLTQMGLPAEMETIQ
ncbi:MAG: DUF1565 domain-containing protein [Pseudanabaenaceae cyanobacterium]